MNCVYVYYSENILNLYRVWVGHHTNDVDSFSINSGERGVPTNGTSYCK